MPMRIVHFMNERNCTVWLFSELQVEPSLNDKLIPPHARNPNANTKHSSGGAGGSNDVSGAQAV